MIFMFVIYTTCFWAYIGTWAIAPLRILSLLSLCLLLAQIFLISLFRIISRDNPTEWWWGYTFWIGRSLFLDKLTYTIKPSNKKWYNYLWFEYWMTPYVSEIQFIGLVLLTLKTLCLFWVSGCIIKYVDTDTLAAIYLKSLVFLRHLNISAAINLLIFIQLFYSVILIYYKYCLGFQLDIFNPIGLCYKYWFQIEHSKQWLQADIMQRNIILTYKSALTKYAFLYEAPRLWTQCYTNVPDHIPYIRTLTIFCDRYFWCYMLLRSRLVLRYKRARYNEFRAEQINKSIFEH